MPDQILDNRTRRDDTTLYRLTKPCHVPKTGEVVRLKPDKDIPPAFGASLKREGRRIQVWIESYNGFKAFFLKVPLLINPLRGYLRLEGIFMPDFQLWDLCPSKERRCDGKIFLYWFEGDTAHAICVKHQITADFPREAIDPRMAYQPAWYFIKVKTLRKHLAVKANDSREKIGMATGEASRPSAQ